MKGREAILKLATATQKRVSIPNPETN